MSESPQTESQLEALDDLFVVRPRSRPHPETDIDITPMIDITFLLLIFFLVTSKLSQQAGVELPTARYGDAVSTKESVTVTITAEEGGGARIYQGDGVLPETELTAESLSDQEEALAAYIRAGIKDPKKRYVLIKAARRVKQRHVARVSHAVGRVKEVEGLFVAVLEDQ